MILRKAGMVPRAIGGNVVLAPDAESIPEAMLLKMSSLCALMRSLDSAQFEVAIAALEAPAAALNLAAAIARLHHPLSEAFIRKQLAEGRDIEQATRLGIAQSARLMLEATSLIRTEESRLVGLVSNDPASFKSALLTIATSSTGQVAAFRNGPVTLGADANGAYWAFPKASEVSALISQTAQAVYNASKISPLYAAIVALVMINCIHPFTDGNGRTSRATFNGLLVANGVMRREHFIPLKFLFALSKYGFEIRLRQVIIQKDWQPVIEYFCQALTVFCAIADGVTVPFRVSATPDRLEDQYLLRHS